MHAQEREDETPSAAVDVGVVRPEDVADEDDVTESGGRGFEGERAVVGDHGV